MSLRTKIVAALVLLAAVSTVLVGVVAYRQTEERLDEEIDRSLRATTEEVVRRARPAPDFPFFSPDRPNRPGEFFGGPIRSAELVVLQSLDAGGTPEFTTSDVALPVGDAEVAVAAAVERVSTTTEVEVEGERFRVLTTAYGDARGAVQVARSLAETDRLLDTLRDRTALAVLLVTVAAAAAGWLIARQVTQRITRLTDAAEHVAATNELTVSVPVQGGDEAGRLAQAFNAMLSALARSKREQQRLVQDAGHELRTPLTSLRTNITLLRRADRLDPDRLAALIDDLDLESRELAHLVDELVDLATDRYRDEVPERLVLADVARAVAERASRRSGREVRVEADGSEVLGRPRALDRAISNLVENALKFDRSGGPVDVTVAAGRVAVADRGPGIDPADRDRVFDRFYRSEAARSQPGSGLGLSIVADIAAAHGGTPFVAERDGGGAVVGFTVVGAGPGL